MKHNYLISDKYCINWDPIMAAREFIANAIDSGDKVTLKWDGQGIVSNSVQELKAEHLLLGNSENRDNEHAIGQFGEGLKIGALVLARLKKETRVDSGDKSFVFSMESLPDFNDSQTLAVEIFPNPHVDGTTVYWECTEEEFDKAKDLFSEFRSPKCLFTCRSGRILDESGAIYVRGVKVQEGLDLLYGYDLNDKKLLNRDRTILNQSSVNEAITSILECCDNKDIVEKLVSNQLDRGETIKFDELNFNLWPNTKASVVWTETLGRLYGDKVCMSSGVTSADARAQYLGYHVLDMGQFSSGLKYKVILKRSTDIKLEKATKFVKKLEPSEKRMWNRAIKLYKLCSGCPNPINGFEISEEIGDDVLAQLQDNTIIASRQLVQSGVAKIFASLCHEGAHLLSSSSDCSASFEAALTLVIENIAKNRLVK